MLSPKLSLAIKKDLKTRLEDESKRLNISQASIINRLLSEYFNEKEKKDNDDEKKN